jgi:hypothetical protein
MKRVLLWTALLATALGATLLLAAPERTAS